MRNEKFKSNIVGEDEIHPWIKIHCIQCIVNSYIFNLQKLENNVHVIVKVNMHLSQILDIFFSFVTALSFTLSIC